ncbi:Uncharacterised protein [Vibrio cholerae]|nr:Uncharacterised protein [Vibrio cholerae]
MHRQSRYQTSTMRKYPWCYSLPRSLWSEVGLGTHLAQQSSHLVGS